MNKVIQKNLDFMFSRGEIYFPAKPFFLNMLSLDFKHNIDFFLNIFQNAT
jgi:hypothetical protein